MCSGCRADANEAAIILLPCNITVFTLDFSGSGLSDGNYVSLGWNEVINLFNLLLFVMGFCGHTIFLFITVFLSWMLKIPSCSFASMTTSLLPEAMWLGCVH